MAKAAEGVSPEAKEVMMEVRMMVEKVAQTAMAEAVEVLALAVARMGAATAADCRRRRDEADHDANWRRSLEWGMEHVAARKSRKGDIRGRFTRHMPSSDTLQIIL